MAEKVDTKDRELDVSQQQCPLNRRSLKERVNSFSPQQEKSQRGQGARSGPVSDEDEL
jgi:hypothetical protein